MDAIQATHLLLHIIIRCRRLTASSTLTHSLARRERAFTMLEYQMTINWKMFQFNSAVRNCRLRNVNRLSVLGEHFKEQSIVSTCPLSRGKNKASTAMRMQQTKGITMMLGVNSHFERIFRSQRETGYTPDFGWLFVRHFMFA